MREDVRRYCFTLQVRPDKVTAYAKHHEAVWPQMLAALRDAGWHNYSIFLRPDGLLIGYVESDDLAAAQYAMSETEVNARWQATTKPFFEGLNGNPNEGLKLVPMVFNLEDQLRASGQSL